MNTDRTSLSPNTWLNGTERCVFSLRQTLLKDALASIVVFFGCFALVYGHRHRFGRATGAGLDYGPGGRSGRRLIGRQPVAGERPGGRLDRAGVGTRATTRAGYARRGRPAGGHAANVDGRAEGRAMVSRDFTGGDSRHAGGHRHSHHRQSGAV